MIGFIIVCSIFVGAKSQLCGPPCLQRSPLPAMVAAPSPDRCCCLTPTMTPYEMAMPAPQTCMQPVVNSPLGCLAPTVTPFGAIAEMPLPGMLPGSLANPFLPAASPVSAMAPLFSPLLPPASPCNCRSQYLKKIPIPPPCI